jgi:transcriptional regulator with XRE-family HTH domain
VAETSALALGRYLRELRERRGLSLARVCEITRNSPDPMDKGTLSRFERGQQSPSIFRLGPLSRIYEISADALLERMELDREVDRLGGPETDGKSYEQLHKAAGESVVQSNRKWEAYAYFRDALPLASPDKKSVARINLVTAIRSLGKNALALHELRELDASGNLDARQRALVHERMSNCCRCLGEMKRAEEYADSAAAQAEALGDTRTLAYAFCTRASAAIDQEQWTSGYDYVMKALAAHRKGVEQQSLVLPSPSFEAQALLMLAECSLNLRNIARARRLTAAAKRISEEHDMPLGLAYSEILLGWIDESDGRVEQALARWRNATAIAARIDYPRIAFTAEVEIFRHATQAGEVARARASRRRLERLVPWIPRYIPAYRKFGQLIGRVEPPLPVAGQGEDHAALSNAPNAHRDDGADPDVGRRRNDRRRAGRNRGPHGVATETR